MANKSNPQSKAHSLRQALKALEAKIASLGDAGLWDEIDASEAVRTRIEASADDAALALEVMAAVVENLSSLLSAPSSPTKRNEMNFMASTEEVNFIDEYIGNAPAHLEQILSNKILPLLYRKRVYYGHMERGSISKLLATELGLDEDSARKAEDLVREFLKASKGIDLDARKPAHGAATTEQTLTLPDAPPKYPYAPRMAGGIIKYLEDNWAPYIEAGILTRPDLKRIDPEASRALRNWLYTHHGPLPHGWIIPTLAEENDRKIKELGLSGPDAKKEAARLASALYRRTTQPE